MRKLCFSLIMVLCYSLMYSQCPQSVITLTTQAQIDNFSVNYPGCTDLLRDIRILDTPLSSADPITNLTGLSPITSINGELEIRGVAPTDLSGLENLVDVDYIRILYNPSLISLDGLNNLSSVKEILIYSNPLLSNINGLENLTDVSKISISGNMVLESLSGLENITSLSRLLVNNNDALINLAGLENLSSVTFELGISDNDYIENLTGLDNLNTLPFNFYISENDNLMSLTGLENVNTTTALKLEISDNALLPDLSGLDILPYYTNITELHVFNNSNLTMCSEEGICNYLAGERVAYIYNNATGCNDIVELLEICTVGPVCPSGGITFTSQIQVDSFAILYPNCGRISGDLVISSNTITNLSGFSNIRFIDGNFEIYDNPLLEEISMGGFHNIEVGGDVVIRNNNAVQAVYAYIKFNGGLYVEDNDILYDISSLDQYYGVEDMTYLKMTNNPNLYLCTLLLLDATLNSPFCTYLYNDGASDIHSNASGCNSVDEIIGNCDFLPIELIDFQAQIENKTILLIWETATETNNEGFEIQRSKDGINWEKIAWQAGQGTSVTPYTYTYRDENPLSGTSYYRLKQVDFDSNYSYSDKVIVNYHNNGISIYPNPVKKTLYIADTNGNVIQSIAIYDQTGRQITQQNEVGNTFDVSSLLPGMYIIKIAFENGVFCEKLIVE